MHVGFIIPDRVIPWDSVHQGIGYVAAYAAKHLPLEECRVFRTHGTTDQEVSNFLDHNWDVVGLTLTGPAVQEAKTIMAMIKSAGPAKIVVGGAQVTTMEERVFELLPETDYAVSGEGEITFCELLECLQNGRDAVGIRGLIYRDEKGAIHKNQPRGFEASLELYPYPDRELFRYDYEFHSIIGTRGCPYRCTFCNSSSNWDHTYRVRKPESIVEEIQYVLKLYGRDKYFAFNDDSFNINKKWVLDLCEQLKDLRIRWWIRGMRTGLITEEVADRIADSGCMGAACGVESANNDSLKKMQKATTIEKIMRGVDRLQSRGLSVTGQFIIGNQGDTLETVKESIECARRFKDATFGIAYPIPHTVLYDFVHNNNYLLPEPVPIKYKGKIIDWVLFDTPWFPVEDRLEAVELAIKARFYHNIEYVPTLTQRIRRWRFLQGPKRLIKKYPKANSKRLSSKIDFAKPVPEGQLLQGWHNVERGFRWMSKSAEVCLLNPKPNRQEKYRLTIKGTAMLDYCPGHKQEVTLRINDSVVGKKLLQKNGEHVIEINFLGAFSETLKLTIELSNSFIPGQHTNSSDSRELGFAVTSIELL